MPIDLEQEITRLRLAQHRLEDAVAQDRKCYDAKLAEQEQQIVTLKREVATLGKFVRRE